MKYKVLIALILIASRLVSLSQNNITNSSVLLGKRNELSISIPIIWSKYEVTNQFGIYGSDKLSDGESYSSGINLTYSRKIFQGLFVAGGLGYFKQNFNFSKNRISTDGSPRTTNSRPFLYDSPDRILFQQNHTAMKIITLFLV